MSCEDQALVATDHCFKWGCEEAKLVLVGIYWCCPICKSSYGTDAKGLAHSSTGGGTAA